MSLDFSGGTARVVTSATVTIGAVASFGGWYYATGMGGGNFGVLFVQGSSSTVYRYLLSFNGVAASNKMRFTSGRGTTDGAWEYTTALSPLTRWRWLGVTYDTGNVANHPIFYVLDQGVWTVLTNGAGLTRATTPVGTVDADNTAVRVGNWQPGTSQWAGYLAHPFAYSRILAEAEMRLVADRGPRRFPRNNLLSWPGVRFNTATMKDDGGSSRDGTGSGTGFATTLVEHPPARW